jgi:hypothetical protein
MHPPIGKITKIAKRTKRQKDKKTHLNLCIFPCGHGLGSLVDEIIYTPNF